MVVHKAIRVFRAKRFWNDMWWISNFINVVVVQMHQCTTSKSEGAVVIVVCVLSKHRKRR